MRKKIKIQIVHWLNGSVLFEYETQDNTVAKTLNEAIKQNADLSSADLRYANLSSADLSSANLSSADLSSADLRYANLSSADLSSADLSSADLRYANLSSADLSSADLSSADLRYANLSSADLSSADLSSADLRYANLRYANLSSADLSSADLSSADLRYANLSSADLSSANLSSAKNSALAVAMTRILPQGTITGYKKCDGGIIVKLQIPARAKRSHAFGRKCRAEYAKVVHIYGADEARSTYDSGFIYRKGDIVHPTNGWDENWTDECSSGIHFFITKEEAENY